VAITKSELYLDSSFVELSCCLDRPAGIFGENFICFVDLLSPSFSCQVRCLLKRNQGHDEVVLLSLGRRMCRFWW
jgi:hypothetical protein